MDNDEFPAEPGFFTTFEKHDELIERQNAFLALDLLVDPASPAEDASDWGQYDKLRLILDTYQEQAYLLDPYLESLVSPVIKTFKNHVQSVVQGGPKASDGRVYRLCLFLYQYIKLRGYKTLVKFFPHEIADLTVVMEYIPHPNGHFNDQNGWPLRYIMLLWLSLVCMLPFDLAQFDEVDQRGQTAKTLEKLAKNHLSNAGLERDGAALLLARLYVRKDTSTLFGSFLEWSLTSLDVSKDPLSCIGILQVLSEVVQSASAEEVKQFSETMMNICNTVDTKLILNLNTVVRKQRVKLLARIGLRLLPAKASRRKGRMLTGDEEKEEATEDVDVPEEIEAILEHLFQSLQDKNTVVRYTTSKGLARISERLPSDFSDQVMETIMSHFAIHSVAAAALYDLPAIAENTWHGACLGCAEMARRSLVKPHHLPALIDWTGKALSFDIRKGSHSIGSSVRDAAAYVLWSLARSQDSKSLLPHANYLAQRLVAVAVFDREIHIRRAASAAFQEHVGRTGFVPHGIDVLQHTDFFSVSMRRNAFLVAAPAVACYQEYRDFLFNHLTDVTVRHWDPAMRQLGAQSLRLLSLINLEEYGPKAEARMSRLLESVDATDIHGALLTFSELADAYRQRYEGIQLEEKLRNLFGYLSKIPEKVVMGPRHEIVTSAACSLLSISLTNSEIELGAQSSVPYWRKLLDYAIKHRSASVQEVAALTLGSLSRLVDCSKTIERYVLRHYTHWIFYTLIRELKAASPIVQQSLGRCLGALAYNKYSNALPSVISCILDCIGSEASPFKNNVEARRNCYAAIPSIVSTVASNIHTYISPSHFQKFLDVLTEGLTDYTSDERGDVGSWIRMTCIRGLTEISSTILLSATSQSDLEAYLPPAKYHSAIGGILKQGSERLDNVRQEAGACFLRLLWLPLPQHAAQWQLEQEELFKSNFPIDSNNSWGDGDWLYPRIVRALDVAAYRLQLLNGIVLSLGSKMDSANRPVATSLVTYCRSLPVSSDTGAFTLSHLIEDILVYAKAKPTSNAIVLPVLQSLNTLLDTDVLDTLDTGKGGLRVLQDLLAFCCKGLSNLKSTPRIHESMKIVVHLLKFKHIYLDVTSSLHYFLTHKFPRIRSDSAEYLFNFLQSTELGLDEDAIEEILLETEWSTEDVAVCDDASQRLVQHMKQDVDQ